ncbi:MAG: TetR/AcrR family transcriptional regulator [Sandaracinaceae bacterium]
MSRPKRADSAHTQEAILAATTRLLRAPSAEPGSLSLRGVAAEAGVSLGTVQYYFGTKEDLFEAYLEAHYARVGAAVAPLAARFAGVSGLDASRALVEEVVRTLYRLGREERECLELRDTTRASRGGLHPRALDRWLGPLLDVGAAALATVMDASELERRLVIQSVIFVATRYALASDAHVETVTRLPAREGRAAIEEHLVALTRRMVFEDAVGH